MNINLVEYQNLLDKAKTLEELKNQLRIQAGIPDFLNDLGTILANKPYSQWPREAKIALDNQPRFWKELYKNNLPVGEAKDHLDSTVDVHKRACYQCDKPVNYLFADGRCKDCTRLTIEEVRGDISHN